MDDIIGRDGETVKSVEEHKYLGAWISSSKKDLYSARAWDIAHRLEPVWTSYMENKSWSINISS